jgi:hypothetical protein
MAMIPLLHIALLVLFVILIYAIIGTGAACPATWHKPVLGPKNVVFSFLAPVVKSAERIPIGLNMELDLQILFGLHVYSCNHWLRHRNLPPSPRIWAHIYEGWSAQD